MNESYIKKISMAIHYSSFITLSCL